MEIETSIPVSVELPNPQNSVDISDDFKPRPISYYTFNGAGTQQIFDSYIWPETLEVTNGDGE